MKEKVLNICRTARRSILLCSVVLLSLPVTSSADVVGDLLGNQLLCNLAEGELANMPIEPLYQEVAGQCIAVTPDSDAGAWYSDDSCTQPVTYERTSMQAYCAAASNRVSLGNGENIRPDSWTLNPGNRLDLGARPLGGVSQPYMQRLVYRSVQTPRGRCDLEMRVYKKQPGDTGGRSLIALHGGSWSARSFGFLGLELTVPHFVNQGFVVYAPFYRLLDNTDSSAACNQADFNDIVDDADAALSWVLDNASQFGSSGAPLLFGQSAGGHLALSLSVNRPSSVIGAVLMYPPTDFTDFLLRVQNGAYTDAQGLSILQRVVGNDVNQVDASLPLVVDNSFPLRIAAEGADWPPMFVVQGSADTLVEPRQAVRLCDALANRPLVDANTEAGQASDLRDVIACGNSSDPTSVLHLIRDGEHALDVCINESISDLCPSGGASSRQLVSQSLGEALDFAVNAFDSNTAYAQDNELDAGSRVSTGGGGALSFWCLGLLLLRLRRLSVSQFLHRVNNVN